MKLFMPRRRKLLLRMEPGSQYQGGVRMQTAFEILAAVYVLSFYDEAIVEATNLVTYEEFVERKKGLCQLARRDTNSEKPLCMFITGPQEPENVISDHGDYI